jgi:AcrR family transcriptional regulator
MARKSKEDAEKTRARILASALVQFAKKGYDHTTFTDISARLKMTKGAVYWHFKSKEALLLALIDEMSAAFKNRIAALMPVGELTYPSVVEMMVRHAELISENPRGTAFFLLMHEQIRWSDASMASVREELLTGDRFGPWRAFKSAVERDVASGRAKGGTSPEDIALISVAVWDGVVHAHISGFKPGPIGPILRTAYAAMWDAIRAR